MAKRKTESAVFGTVAQSIDLEAIRESSIRRFELEMGRPEVSYQRKPDGVDWARKIMARIKAGEKLPIISHTMAKEALELAAKERGREPGEDDEG